MAGGQGETAVWDGTTWTLADAIPEGSFETVFAIDVGEVWVGGDVGNTAAIFAPRGPAGESRISLSPFLTDPP